ncbi:15682_t:CDS:2, partial [Acaulospora morrowiae]
IASLMAYLARNEVFVRGDLMENEDNRLVKGTKSILEDSQLSAKLFGGRESPAEKLLLQSFEKYKSYNYKSGSGDVNETALDYSNPNKPRLAMAYIANVDPNYNMPGNLQFLDIASGSAYNLYGHHAPDAITKGELWTTVTDVKFSPDGKFIFSASTDATIKTWYMEDSRKFQRPYNVKVCQSGINRLAVRNAPKDGTIYQFASCEESGMIQLHSIRKDYNKFHLFSQDFKDENRKRSAND